jgi:zinc/manganese transport system ATP-binding protein
VTDGTTRSPALVLDDVAVVRGGRTVWSDGTLSVAAGAVVGVIGPNGAGKTTLFQVALGLLPVASGRVEVLGAPPRRGNRRIGYVPQNYTSALGDAVRCRDLVTLGLTGGRFGLRRTTAGERARVDAALERVGATEYADRRMSELSGG